MDCLRCRKWQKRYMKEFIRKREKKIKEKKLNAIDLKLDECLKGKYLEYERFAKEKLENLQKELQEKERELLK